MPQHTQPAETADRPREHEGGIEDSRVLTTRQLFGRQSQIEIEHAGVIYRLRITKQGKLVLNK